MIGRHDPKKIWETGIKESVSIGLDESLTSLMESFNDLSDDVVRAYPIEGRHNISTLVMHCLQNLDGNVNWVLSTMLSGEKGGGSVTFEHEERFELWGLPEEKKPKPGDDFPGVRELSDMYDNVSKRAIELVDSLKPAPHYWPRVADPCLRSVYHTAGHVRQIWLLRGALGLTDGRSWPRQHWA